jgi:hypothetical protein
MEDAKKEKEAMLNGEEPQLEIEKVQMELEPEETCCVCYDEMDNQ